MYLIIGGAGIIVGIILKNKYKNAEIFVVNNKNNFCWSLYPIGYAIYLFIAYIKEKLYIYSNDNQRYKQLQSIYVKNKVDTELIFHESRKYTILFIGIIVSLLAISLVIISNPKEIALSENVLKRSEYGTSENSYNLLVEGVTDKKEDIQIQVAPKQYTKEEIENIFEEIYLYLQKEVLGENSSLEHVTQNLNFTQSLPYKGIAIEWICDNYQLIDETGQVIAEQINEEGILTSVTATLSYEEYQESYQFPIYLFPKYQTESEKNISQIKNYIEEADVDSKTEDVVNLPDTYLGKTLTYYLKGDASYSGIILAVFVLLTIILAWKYDFDLKEKVQSREKQMSLDYSEIVSKFTILIGAGMTIRGAWEKIVQDYINKKNKNKKYYRYAYEEMVYSCYRMQSGLSEKEAYIEYGHRCHVHSYLKLSNIFNQNLIKGNQGITALLKKESQEAFLEYKHTVRRMGEKMSTKLMLPMILSFALVMVIIIFPAFMSFSANIN